MIDSLSVIVSFYITFSRISNKLKFNSFDFKFHKLLKPIGHEGKTNEYKKRIIIYLYFCVSNL